VAIVPFQQSPIPKKFLWAGQNIAGFSGGAETGFRIGAL
jgi:hypothetical protein